MGPRAPLDQLPDYAEFHVWEASEDHAAQDAWLNRWAPHLQGRRVLDVGCGEGHLLAAMTRHGLDAEGVDVTPSLVERARSRGLRVAQEDAATFITSNAARFSAFTLMDFVEHVPFEVTVNILRAVPLDGIVVIQTPNTNSIIGHQFYLQVPGHVTPLSPHVLHRALARCGYTISTEGTLYGGLPWTGIRRRVAEFLLVKLLGTVTTRLLTEGANYFVVAKRVSQGVDTLKPPG